ncbi:succinate dehydrogenase/fumarate reductase flavoprotein subunit [Anaerocolumna cellulosilytica]|uniref:Urocanate reductase n=1 Tax=Anaerocolumna cellulosilytica TaxID=433286 RepID=A0A6S6R593_9FIRM|nr:FAD-dependent oxidoreductase [Anaerocolumna cellulosilytica]MBB5194166.1 fumarate reductase flavoprotein subunit [Anaerocolumna cellulosilytica]BCJ94622.1 succinate dehydrogenase/fumarate reductase flavoprotein subunit [Anaerocolumna cellulosilytica]
MMKRVFVVLLSFVLAFGLAGCADKKKEKPVNNSAEQSTGKEVTTAFKAGTYTGQADGRNGLIKVEVIVNDMSIESIKVLESSETEGIGDTAIENLTQDILTKQSIGLDAVSGATVTSEAFLNAVEDALKQAGGDLKALKAAITKENEGKTVELTADVVVIGAGGTGVAAAVTSAEHGAKVIVLEKTAIPGGTTANGGGFFAADSAKARALGQKAVDTDYIFKEWMAEMDWLADASLVKQFLSLSHTTADWLEEHGVIFHKTEEAVQQSHQEGTNGYHKYDDYTKTSSQLGAMLDKIVKDYSAEVYYETPAKSVITEGNKVIGVTAVAKDGSTLKITAKSVIIASGGFVGDSEMIKDALNGVSVNAAGYNSNVGDGIKMAWDIGAASRGLSAMVAHTFAVEGNGKVEGDYEFMELYQATSSVAYMPIIPWINGSGVRFANEDIVYDRALSSNSVIAQGNFAYFVYNDKLLKTLETKGARAAGMRDKIAMGPMPEITPMDSGWSNLTEIVDKMVKAGYVVKADSLDDLAKKLNIDKETLKETMDKYNADAMKGIDSLYGKDGKHMYPLTEGPYYAFKVTVNNLCTVGGIRINSDFQVVQDDPENGYTPIANLYAAGADAGGIYSDHYAHTIEGAAQGWAYNSGRLAGANATENALDVKIDLFTE